MENRLGIGYWDITDPEHPDYAHGTIENINVDPPSPPDPSSAVTIYAALPENTPAPQTHYSSPTPGLTIASTSTVTFPTAPSPTNFSIQTAPIQPTTMSASATGGRMLRYCRNVRPTWVKFNSKDTKESE